MPPLSRRKEAERSSSKETIPEDNENEKMKFPKMTYDQFTEYTNIVDIMKREILRKFPNRLNNISNFVKRVYKKYSENQPSCRQNLIEHGFKIEPKPWTTKADRERKKFKIKDCCVRFDRFNISHITGLNVMECMRNENSNEKALQEDISANFSYYVNENIRLLATVHGGLDKTVHWFSREAKRLELKSVSASRSEIDTENVKNKRKPGPFRKKSKPITEEIKLSKEKAGPSSQNGSRTKSPCPSLVASEIEELHPNLEAGNVQRTKPNSEIDTEKVDNKRKPGPLGKKTNPLTEELKLSRERVGPSSGNRSRTKSPCPSLVASGIEELHPNLEAGNVQRRNTNSEIDTEKVDNKRKPGPLRKKTKPLTEELKPSKEKAGPSCENRNRTKSPCPSLVASEIEELRLILEAGNVQRRNTNSEIDTEKVDNKRKPGPLGKKTNPLTEELKPSKEKAGPSSENRNRTKSPCPSLVASGIEELHPNLEADNVQRRNTNSEIDTEKVDNKRKPGPLRKKAKPITEELKLSRERVGPSSGNRSRTKSPCPSLVASEIEELHPNLEAGNVQRTNTNSEIDSEKVDNKRKPGPLRKKTKPLTEEVKLLNEKAGPSSENTNRTKSHCLCIIASKIQELYPNLEAGNVQRIVKKYRKNKLQRNDVTEIMNAASNNSEVNNAHGLSSQPESKCNSVCSEELQTGDKGEEKAVQTIRVGKKRKKSDCSSTESTKKSRQTINILPTDIVFEDIRSLTNVESIIRNDILRKFPSTSDKYLGKIEQFIKRYYVENFLKSSKWPKELKIHDRTVRTLDDFVKFKKAWDMRESGLDINKNAVSDLEINREHAANNTHDIIIIQSAIASDELHPSPELFPSSGNTDEKLTDNCAKSLAEESPILEIVNIDNISFTQRQNFENYDPLNISVLLSVETQNLENTKGDEYILSSVLTADAPTVTENQSEELSVTQEFDSIAVTDIQSEQLSVTQEFDSIAVTDIQSEQLIAMQELKSELHKFGSNKRQSSTHESESSVKKSVENPVLSSPVKRQRNPAEIIQERIRVLDKLNASIKNETPVEFKIDKDPYNFKDLNFGPASGNNVFGDLLDKCMRQSLGSSSASNIQLAFEEPANPIESRSIESVVPNSSRENSIRSTHDETVTIKKEVSVLNCSQYEDEVEFVEPDRETTIIISDETPNIDNLLDEMMNNILDSDKECSEIMAPPHSPLNHSEFDGLELMDVSPVGSEGATVPAFQRSPADATKVSNGEAILVRNEEATPVGNVESTLVQNEESTPVQNEVSTPVQNEESTAIPNEESTAIPNEEGTPVPDDEASPVRNKITTSIPNKEATSSHDSGVLGGNTETKSFRNVGTMTVGSNQQKPVKRLKSTASAVSTRTKRRKKKITKEDLATSILAAQNTHSFEPLDFVGNSKMIRTASRPTSSKPSTNTIRKRKSIDRDFLIEDPSLDNIGTPVKQRSMTVSQILNTDESFFNNLQDLSVGNSHSSAVVNLETCADETAVHETEILVESIIPETSNNRQPETIEKLPHFFFNQKYNCITDLSLHQVAGSTQITNIHYVSKVPFLEPIERKSVRAIITFRNDGFNRLIIAGDSLKFKLGLSDMRWECFLNLLRVLDAFEDTPIITTDPIDKSLPVRVLAHQFKTLPKFSQIALEYSNCERHVKSTVDYFQHIDSLAEAFTYPERQVPSHIEI